MKIPPSIRALRGHSTPTLVLAVAVLILYALWFWPASEDDPERVLIKSGSKWEELAAYSRAVVDGDWIFVSGTVGFNPENSSIPEDFNAQMDQIFTNISWALEQADSGLEDIVRVRCFLVDPQFVNDMSAKLHQYLGDVQPTNTTVVTALAAEGALIEVEVTALRQ